MSEQVLPSHADASGDEPPSFVSDSLTRLTPDERRVQASRVARALAIALAHPTALELANRSQPPTIASVWHGFDWVPAGQLVKVHIVIENYDYAEVFVPGSDRPHDIVEGQAFTFVATQTGQVVVRAYNAFTLNRADSSQQEYVEERSKPLRVVQVPSPSPFTLPRFQPPTLSAESIAFLAKSLAQRRLEALDAEALVDPDSTAGVAAGTRDTATASINDLMGSLADAVAASSDLTAALGNVLAVTPAQLGIPDAPSPVDLLRRGRRP